jgi:hypothetical protein
MNETPRTDEKIEQIRGDYKIFIHDEIYIAGDFARQLERELTSVTEQRDRLAEALRKAILWGESASHRIFDRENINWTYLNEAREALQSLTPNAEP